MVNLDDLIKEIRAISPEPPVQGAADVLLAWKASDATAEELRSTVERYLGNVWIEREQDHARIYAMWSAFSREAVDAIQGMTMNERLYWFGLFARFEASAGETSRLAVYKKLHASP